MKRQKSKPTPNPIAIAIAKPEPPDPVEVIAQALADQTGLSRHNAKERLIMLGHCVLRANKAGQNTVIHEIETLSAAKHAEDEARRLVG